MAKYRKQNRPKKRSNGTNRQANLDFGELENRQLMAADIGLAMDAMVVVQGPQVEVVQTTQAESSSRKTSADMTKDRRIVIGEVSLDRETRTVTVNGTNQHDDVTVEYDGTGNVEFVVSTTDKDGTVNTSRTRIDADEFNTIKFFGHNGNDSFDNGTAKSLIASGGYGYDTIFGGSGNDQLFGGHWNDHLEGRGGDDLLSGGGGNDTLRGNAGHDQIFGSVGNDILAGNSGNDYLVGGAGNDKMYGGSGQDTMYGLYENAQDEPYTDDDYMKGGSGNDKMYGGFGSDKMWGGTGNDTMRGEKGSDKMYGESGNDKMYGGWGLDYLYGQHGNDRLDGGNDETRDMLFGGYGADEFVRHENWSWWYGDDPDSFLDRNSGEGDSVDTDIHYSPY